MDSQNRENMELLYDQYVDDIFRYIQFRIRNREKALDLTQEVFIRVWQSYLSKGNSLDFPKALLYKVAHNLLVNSYQRDISYYSLDEMSEEGFEVKDTANDFQKIFDVRDLYQAISQLSKKDAEIILLKYIEGFSVKEISEIYNISENALSVRLHRAISKLEEIYNHDSKTTNE